MLVRMAFLLLAFNLLLIPEALADDYGIDVQLGKDKTGAVGVWEREARFFLSNVPPKATFEWELHPKKNTVIAMPASGGALCYEVENGAPRVRFRSRNVDLPTMRWDVVGKLETYTVQAANGDFAGWYLDFEEKPEELGVVDGKARLGHRLILVKEPKEPRKFNIYQVSK